VWENELAGELALCHEVMDKVRGMESKLEYQVKKLVGLAEAAAKPQTEEVEEDPLSFRPNPSAMVAAARTEEKKAAAAAKDDDEEGGVYRPPRVAAMPYNEPGSQRRERRAPALLSEFAQTMDGAPAVQTTSGLSTRPVLAGAHTNSVSAKRAAELKRLAEWEEDNMTRLVTTKREAKRRREDEEALALGFGVGGRGRARRQNGLEAELEGVLGERGSKGVWDNTGVQALGMREGITGRAKRAAEDSGPRKSLKKSRFEKDVKRKRRAIGLPTK
jgi:U3 small nucleolar ribonucleoprotein protein LCP5